MKVIFDKLNEGEYSISAKEIRLLFGLIPELTSFIKLVHVQGQEPAKSLFPRPARYQGLSSKLNLSVKGLDKDSIVLEILIELISQNSKHSSLRPLRGRTHTKEKLNKIKSIAAPIIDKFNEINKS